MIDWSKLKEPFSEEDIEWRLQSCGEKNGKIWGKALAYVTNRAIQTRLDTVVGVENWKNEFLTAPDGGVMCGISIRVERENGTYEWVTKYDGAENTQVEAVKGGLSGSMKRCAVQFGIGRYLYQLPVGWIEVSDTGVNQGKTKDGKWFNWNPPKLPAWALPKADVVAIEKLKQNVLDYINIGVLKGDLETKAVKYINEGNMKGLQATVEWCKKQNQPA